MLNIRISLTLLTLILLAPATASTALAEESKQESNTNVNVIQTVIIPKEDEGEDKVRLTLSDGREAARPGQILTFRAVVHNPLEDDVNEIQVKVQIPQYLIPVATSPQAKTDPAQRTLTWDNQSVSAGADVTYSFKARVSADAPDERILYTEADINGPGIRDSATDETTVQTISAAENKDEASSSDSQDTAHAAVKPVPVTATTGSSPAMALLTALLSFPAAAYFLITRTQ